MTRVEIYFSSLVIFMEVNVTLVYWARKWGPGTRVYGNRKSYGKPSRSQFGPNTSHRQGHKMASAMPADSSQNLQLSRRNDGARTSHNCQRSLHIIANENKRLLIKENIFLDLSAMVFEDHYLNKGNIIWKKEHNFSIIWPKKEQCYWHDMLLLLAQSIKA